MPEQAQNASCGTCAWWRVQSECHRFPPHACEPHETIRWPLTNDREWCAEWVDGTPYVSEDGKRYVEVNVRCEGVDTPNARS